MAVGELELQAYGGALQACGWLSPRFYACGTLRADALRGRTVGGLLSTPKTLSRIGVGPAAGWLRDFESGFFLSAPAVSVEVNARLGVRFF